MFGTPIHIKKIDLAELSSLNVSTALGDIEVIGGNYPEVTMEVYGWKRSFMSFFQKEELSKSEFDRHQFRILKEDGNLKIYSVADDNSRFNSWLNLHSISFRIYVPENFSTDTAAALGDIRLKNMDGNHYLKTRIGSIYLEKIKGTVVSGSKNFGKLIHIDRCFAKVNMSSGGASINVFNSGGEHSYNTDGGNIKIVDFKGNLYSKTKGGNIRTERMNGDFKVITWGGNIKLYEMEGNVAATTSGGNIEADMKHLNEYLWLETSGGNIKTYLPANVGMQLEAKGAKIRNYGFKNIEGAQSFQRLHGKVNGGGSHVNLRTMGGNIRIYSKNILQDAAYTKPKIEVKEVKTSKPQPEKQLHIQPPKPQPAPRREREPQIRKEKIVSKSKSWSIKPYLPGFSQTIYALLFTVLFVYGLNSITYFTSELFNPTSLEAEQNKAIFLLNLITGISAFSGLIIFITFVDHFINRLWLKYLTLVGCTSVFYAFYLFLVRKIYEYYDFQHEFWRYFWGITQPQKYEITPSFTVIFYGVIPSVVALAYFIYWQRSRNMSRKITEQEYQLLNLEKMKTKAQLNALEARINPHFLYNSLNSIAGLIHEDADKAEDMTIELSKLFRATTGRNEEIKHSIAEEIDLVKSYLQIEQMRFGQRLSYEITVDPVLENIKIPRFLLQPLVENAIKHGISKIKENGNIRLSIIEKDNYIIIEIHDNGPAFGESISGGYGLRSVREKLQLLYGEHAEMEIKDEPEKLLTIRIDKNHEL